MFPEPRKIVGPEFQHHSIIPPYSLVLLPNIPRSNQSNTAIAALILAAKNELFRIGATHTSKMSHTLYVQYQGIWNYKSQHSSNSCSSNRQPSRTTRSTTQHSRPPGRVSIPPAIVQFTSATNIHDKANFILTKSVCVQKWQWSFPPSQVFGFFKSWSILQEQDRKIGAGTVPNDLSKTASLGKKWHCWWIKLLPYCLM